MSPAIKHHLSSPQIQMGQGYMPKVHLSGLHGISIARSLGNWFCMSRKLVGTGGGGLVHPESENSMAMYGLAVKIPQ